MKKTLVLAPALVTMLFVSGNGMSDVTSTASAQEVSTARKLQATAVVESSKNRELITSIMADSTLQNRSVESVITTNDASSLVYLGITDKPQVDSAALASNKPAMGVDSLSVSTEKPAEESAEAVPNKPYKSKIVYWGGRDRNGKFTEECAAHANGRLKKAGYYSFGHAYQIPSHYPSVMNGYTKVKVPDLSKLSWEKRFPAVLNMHRQAADYIKANLDVSKLVPGRFYVVNMYYSTSSHMLEFFYAARKQGTGNYATHVGVLYYDKKAQSWIVEHNIHGHVHYDALVSVLGGRSNPHKYGVTSISRVTK